MKPVVALLCVAGLLRSAFAQDAAPQNPDPVEKARSVYREIHEQRDASKKELEALKLAAKQYSDKSEERREIDEKAKTAFKNSKAPLDPFFAVFKDVDWTKFDVQKDKQLLRDGLAEIAIKPSYREKAIEAGRMFVKLFPEDRVSSAILARSLPLTLVSLDRIDDAVKELQANSDKDKDVRAMAFVMLGDIESIRGNFDAAKKAFADASNLGGKATSDIALARAAVIGKPAPSLDGANWIGADAIPMADLKGKVVMLGFFATWAPPARTALTTWNEMRDEYLKDGVVCLAVAKPYPHGYLPADESQIEVGGTSRQGMDPAAYLDHLKQYHTNTKQHLPFVVITEETFKGYGVMPVPTVVLVDGEGRIRMVSTRQQDDDLVRFGVRTLLKKP